MTRSKNSRKGKAHAPKIRRDHNGEVDEVCVKSPQSVHIERMGTHSWWMRIECGDSAVVVNFTARSMPLVEVEKTTRQAPAKEDEER